MPALVTATPIAVDLTNEAAPIAPELNRFGLFQVGANVYQVLFQRASGAVFPHVYKSTDGGSTWNEMNAAGVPAVSSQGQSPAFFNPATGLIWVLMRNSGAHAVVASFNTGTDTWGAASTPAAGTSPPSGAIYQQSGGTVVVVGVSGSAIQYNTFSGGVWAGWTNLGSGFGGGSGAYQITVDASDIAYFLYSDASGNLQQLTISLTFVPGTPTQLALGTAWDQNYTDMRIWNGNLAVAWTELNLSGNPATLKVAIGTLATEIVFTTYTIYTLVDANFVWSFLATDRSGNLVVFFDSTNQAPSPVAVQVLMWTFNGVSSWGSPTLFYDAIANPPASAPISTNQVLQSGAGIQLANGSWVTSIAMQITNASSVNQRMFGVVSPASSLALACASSVAQVFVPYSSALVATGGTPPYTFAIIAGALPPGLTLNTATGAITGVPTTAGTYNYTAQVTDSTSATATASCSIVVAGGPPGSQLAFYGVRRIKLASVQSPREQRARWSDPAPSTYQYYEKSFQIPVSFKITAAYNSSVPLLSQAVRVLTRIDDYDFELRHITKYCVDGAGAALATTSPFAVILYDSVYVARMNAPLLAEYLFDDVKAPNGRNFWPSPPIMYPVNANIPLDIFSLIASSVTLPVTVNLLFDGVRRIPCV
jgi:hypothetical protein